MLYDPKWEVKTTEPSLEGMIAWLEKQDPTRTYPWYNYTGGCLIGLYGASLGFLYQRMCNEPSKTDNYYQRCVDHGGKGPYSGDIAYTKPHTFGDALERARACLAAR